MEISRLSQYKIERQSIVDALVESKGCIKGVVLDLGCGNKPYAGIFECEKYVGIDFRGGDVLGSVMMLPFKDESFDSVLSTQVLEHVAEPADLLKEAFRVLKGGGYAVITVPMCWGLHEEPHDYYRYTKYGLLYLAEKTGFDVVEIKERCGFWAMIGQRLSARIYYIGGEPDGLVGRGLKGVICGVVQGLFLVMDKVDYQSGETLGYVAILRKELRSMCDKNESENNRI